MDKNTLFIINGKVASLEDMALAWIAKMNPNHDEHGRFAEGGGGGSGASGAAGGASGDGEKKTELQGVELKPEGAKGFYKPNTPAGTRERLKEITGSQLTGELKDMFVSPKQKDLQDKWEKANRRQDRTMSQRYSKELGKVKTDDMKRALHLNNNIPVFSSSTGSARAENILDHKW